jgi:antitoxin component YwqK of YwqJK toxin-antitoxin module
MGVDFTARQVRFLSSFIILLVYTSGCQSSENLQCYNTSDRNFTQVNGLIYFEEKPFTGFTYSLYPFSKDTAEIAGYSRGKEDGFRRKFYPNHVPKEVRKFDHGRKTGVYNAWWENGNRKLQYFFREDEYEGACREWNMDGRLIREMNYVKGHESGPQRMFYDNGKIRANYIITEGRRYGLLGTKNCVNVPDSVFTN